MRAAVLAVAAIWPFLLPPALPAQSAREIAEKAAEDQLKWYDPKLERKDLTPGAFEVVRFPTGYEFKSRYRHDPKKHKRLLNPDFWCNVCERERRIPEDPKREDRRVMERDLPQVLDWIERRLKQRGYTYIEDDTFKLYFDLEGVNLKRFPDQFLKSELIELGDIFPKVTEKTVVIDGHKRAHLYLIRAHRLLRDFWWMVGTTNEGVRTTYPYLGPYMGMNNKQEVFVFSKERHYHAFADHFIGRTSTDGQCWHHFRDRAMLMMMKGEGQKDPQTRNYFFHRIAHNFADGFRMYSFKLPAWFQMGLGHWVERRETTSYNTFCFSEGTLPEVLIATRWMPRIKKMIAKGEVMPFVEACSATEYGDFDPRYHMISWSWFSFMLRLGPEKLRVWMSAMKGKKKEEPLYQAQVRAFREAYGLNLIQFDKAWREWAMAVYPDL